jgi:hypothetical protein
MNTTSSLFAKPWHLVEDVGSFRIDDDAGHVLAHIPFEDEPRRAAVMKRISKEDARRLATQIVRLPELLHENQMLRAARDEPA